MKLEFELKPALKPIHTKIEEEAALREIVVYFDSEPACGTAAGDRFEILAMLIKNYGAKHTAILPPDPLEAIKFRRNRRA